jgi:hypothetical protein
VIATFEIGKTYIARIAENKRRNGTILINNIKGDRITFILRDGTVMVGDILVDKEAGSQYISFYTRAGRKGKERRAYAAEIDI